MEAADDDAEAIEAGRRVGADARNAMGLACGYPRDPVIEEECDVIPGLGDAPYHPVIVVTVRVGEGAGWMAEGVFQDPMRLLNFGADRGLVAPVDAGMGERMASHCHAAALHAPQLRAPQLRRARRGGRARPKRGDRRAPLAVSNALQLPH